MNKSRLITFVGIVSIAVIVAISFPLATTKAETGHDHPGETDMKKDMKKHVKADVLTLEKIHSKHLPMVSRSIDKAIEAVGADDKETALTELYKARKMLAAINAGIAKHVKPKFANVTCPIMGTPIYPDKVTKSLIRDYKGQKVAFCCGGCPATWDKLTNTEKDAKLAKVKLTPTKNHSEHKMH